MDTEATGDGPRADVVITMGCGDSTCHMTLRPLKQAGTVRGTWDTAAGRPRRTYTLTAASRRSLAGRREGWREFAAVVSALMEGRPCPGTP